MVDKVWQMQEPNTPATPCASLDVVVPPTPMGWPLTPVELRMGLPRPVPKTPLQIAGKSMEALRISPLRKRQKMRTVWPGSPPQVDEQTAISPTEAAPDQHTPGTSAGNNSSIIGSPWGSHTSPAAPGSYTPTVSLGAEDDQDDVSYDDTIERLAAPGHLGFAANAGHLGFAANEFAAVSDGQQQ